MTDRAANFAAELKRLQRTLMEREFIYLDMKQEVAKLKEEIEWLKGDGRNVLSWFRHQKDLSEKKLWQEVANRQMLERELNAARKRIRELEQEKERAA